jgi:hypothetical protein
MLCHFFPQFGTERPDQTVPSGSEQKVGMGGRPQAVKGHPGWNKRQGLEEKPEILFPGKERHLSLFIKSCQSGITNNLQMMELQVLDPHGAKRLQRKKHIVPALSGNSENQMGTNLKTAFRMYPEGGIVKIGKIVITIEEFQTPFMDALHTQFEKAFLAHFSYQVGQWSKQLIRHIIRPCGKYQADTVDIRHQSLEDGQQFPNWNDRAGFLLEVGEVFFESAPEKIRLPFSNLLGDVVAASQIGRGKTCRSTENAAAGSAVGAGQPQIQGDFSDALAKFLPVLITEGTEGQGLENNQLFTKIQVQEATLQGPFGHMMDSMLVAPIANIILTFALFYDNSFPRLAKSHH